MIPTCRACALCLLGLLVAQPAWAQEKKDPQSSYEPRSKPGAGQKLLEKYVGDWQVIKTFYPRTGAPFRMTGTCRQRMIHDGRFLQSDFIFDGGGTKTTGLGLIGFDTETDKFTRVWTDSRATKMSFRQSQDPFDGAEIVLQGRGLGNDSKTQRPSRTVTRLEDEGRRLVHRQFGRDAAGNERLVMELLLTRQAE
jgi:hypothetical protein